jgi:Flp pilus assembly pilin Flp
MSLEPEAVIGDRSADMHTKLWKAVWRLLACDTGQDLLEYALLVSLIALVAVGAVTEVGNTINTVFWQAIAAANV